MGYRFHGTICSSNGNHYILVVVDYVSKWVKLVVLPINDSNGVVNFLKKNILTQFGTPHPIISDGGSYFFNRNLGSLLRKYRMKHQVVTSNHPQTNGQVGVSKRELKSIPTKMINGNQTYCSMKLDDVFWVFHTTYNTSIGISLYQLMFGKTCHLQVDLEHQALWALKKLNFDKDDAINECLGQLHLMDEFRLRTYETSAL